MKRIILLLMVLGVMDIAVPANAQQHRRHNKRHKHHTKQMQHTTYRFPKAEKNREREKSLDNMTTGVPTEERVKLNEKGKYQNMNTNTGVPLPPMAGNNSK